jgi:hypothetical protein
VASRAHARTPPWHEGSQLLSLICRLIRDDRAITTLEYVLTAAAMVVVIAIAASSISVNFDRLAAALDTMVSRL